MIPSVAAARGLTEAPTGRAGPTGLQIRLTAMLRRTGGRMILFPHRRISLANPQRGGFVPDGIDRTAELTSNPLRGVRAIVTAHERDFGTAPRTATGVATAGVRTTGGFAPVVTAGTTTILTSSHGELLV